MLVNLVVRREELRGMGAEDVLRETCDGWFSPVHTCCYRSAGSRDFVLLADSAGVQLGMLTRRGIQWTRLTPG